MPMLGDVKAAGLTPIQLLAAITEKLKQHNIENQYITVVVTQVKGKWISQRQIYQQMYEQRSMPIPQYRYPTRDVPSTPDGLIFKG